MFVRGYARASDARASYVRVRMRVCAGERFWGCAGVLARLTHLRRPMSHTMQLPSLLAEANSLPDGLTTMLVTRALCSLIDATIERLCGPMRHTRTRPSPPPDSTRAQSDVVASAVTPPEWASCTLCVRARARAYVWARVCVRASDARAQV